MGAKWADAGGGLDLKSKEVDTGAADTGEQACWEIEQAGKSRVLETQHRTLSAALLEWEGAAGNNIL